MKTLKKQLEAVVDKYIKAFEKKQELSFEGWIGDEIISIACFEGEINFFNFTDIVYDINSNQPPELITQWMQDSVDNQSTSINYKTYSKGLRFEDLK